MQILFIEVNNFKTDDMHVDKWNRHTHNTNKLVLVLFSLEAVLGWGGWISTSSTPVPVCQLTMPAKTTHSFTCTSHLWLYCLCCCQVKEDILELVGHPSLATMGELRQTYLYKPDSHGNVVDDGDDDSTTSGNGSHRMPSACSSPELSDQRLQVR